MFPQFVLSVFYWNNAHAVSWLVQKYGNTLFYGVIVTRYMHLLL